jgi:hypothetical protein
MGLRRQFSTGSLLMYMLTFTLEVTVLILRAWLALILSWIVLAATGLPSSAGEIMVDIAVLPTIWSVLALVWPGGSGWWWCQRLGGLGSARGCASASCWRCAGAT